MGVYPMQVFLAAKCCGQRKKPAAPYSRTGESRTTLGDGALNFRVRNGNGCDNSSMATGKKAVSWELKRITTSRDANRSHFEVKFYKK